MIGLVVRHPPIVVIPEVDFSTEDGPIPRHHFIQAARLEGDMMQRGFDDRHCRPPKTVPTSLAAAGSSRHSRRIEPSATAGVSRIRSSRWRRYPAGQVSREVADKILNLIALIGR
jgi:hypothetical protein